MLNIRNSFFPSHLYNVYVLYKSYQSIHNVNF